MEDGRVCIHDGIEVMKFEDGTWILYEENAEPLALNKSASEALDQALQHGVQGGLEQYLKDVREEFCDITALHEAEEDYYYTLDICRTRGLVDINNI